MHEARELELRRRADGGDKQAAYELEAYSLRLGADRAVSSLRDKAAAGDMTAMSQLRQLASGDVWRAPGATSAKAPATTANTRTSAPARPAGGSRITAEDIGAARITARAKERNRWSTVFANEHSKGRERGCVTLLTSDKGWSAEQIVANLAELPTDRQGANSGTRAAAADAVWDKAHALNQRDHADGGTATPGADGPATNSSDAVWDHARAIVDSTRAKAN